MIRKGLFGTADLFATIGAALVLLMMLHIVVDVMLRFFNIPLQATIEIVQSWYMVPIAFLPLAYVEKLNGHISVELVSQHLSSRAQELLVAGVCVLSAFYFGAFAWRTGVDAIGKYEVGEMALGDVAIVVWPTRFILPVGCALITVLLIYKAFRLAFAKDSSLLAKDSSTSLAE
jgi:TRAP-type C4-dicarboxylate transport system permease small subunit